MRIFLQSALLFFLLVSGTSLSAQNSTKINVDKNQLAIQGYDPVAYFEDHKPVKGSDAFKFKFENAVYQFASQSHLNTFKKNPEKYVPEYGGYCAYGVSKGYAVSIDPTAWSIVEGKLYLNYSHNVQNKWNDDKPGFIKKANQNWPTVAGKN